MTKFAIRINAPGQYKYWSHNAEHGAGWRERLYSKTMWTLEQVIDELRTIAALPNMPSLTIVPIPMPKISVCKEDGLVLVEAIRLAISATNNPPFKEQLRDIQSRLTPTADY